MVRTRDFLVYVLTLVFLVSAIGFTVLSDSNTPSERVAKQVTFVPNTATAYGALASGTDGEDRTAYIEAMKAKLARGEGRIEGAPVVFTSVDDFVAATTNTYDGERTILWCDVPERVDHILTLWHERPVTLETLEGARVAIQQTASSSNKALLQLPMRTTRAPHDSCLAHEIVGVGTDGGLITNDQVWRFFGSNTDTLLGYALDGFPIHGFAADESQLDQCGGMSTPSGYAYFLRGGEDFILGCFASAPAVFLE
ncbi:MAG: hypothetical protein WDZ93_01060 [Candidatus Paceibacterota bacterium]